jgi:hypothetical protein
METGTEANPASEIDSLHAQLAAETGANTAEDSGLATQSDPADRAGSGVGPNADLCEEVLDTVLRFYSRHTREAIADSLAPIEEAVGRDQIERIAARAEMPEGMRKLISERGARVLSKYNLSRFVSDEALLVSAVLAHVASVRAVKRDRDELLRKFTRANTPQGNGDVKSEANHGA